MLDSLSHRASELEPGGVGAAPAAAPLSALGGPEPAPTDASVRPAPRLHPLLECIPNFSEGRRADVIDAIVAAAAGIPGVVVLDCEHDASHNRMVLTLVGPPEAVCAAALAASHEAVTRIDLTRHQGQHPRMGAVDVVPFVPLRDCSMEDCIAAARNFGATFAERFGVPVFLYEAAATRPERRNLAAVRAGQFEGLAAAIGHDPARAPDFGPAQIHPTAGATAVGARPVLIAYNVELASTDLDAARAIARRVRERDGGLPAVKALGFELPERGRVQVSMNLTDYHRTAVHTAFAAVEEAASALGIEVAASEVVGLIPLEAVVLAARQMLRLETFAPEQVLEQRLLALGPGTGTHADRLVDTSLAAFAASVAARTPVPGGGSVAAYAGALAASLVEMVCRLTRDKRGYEAVRDRIGAIEAEAGGLETKLLDLVDRDARTFAEVATALALPRSTADEVAERRGRLDRALRAATEVPALTVEHAHRVLELAREVADSGNRNARSDAETALGMARAALAGALSNVRINLEGLRRDPAFVDAVTRRMAAPAAALDRTH